MPVSSIKHTKPKNDFDVVVIGSGAAGLSTALSSAQQGLKVAVFEKSSVIGGTSAWSGGWMWLPQNPYAKEAGIADSKEEVKRYLTSVAKGSDLDPRVDTFLDAAPKMVEHYRSTTSVNFIAGNKVPDMQDLPGSVTGGRSLCAAPFNGRKLGKNIHFLRRPLDIASVWGMGIGSFELRQFYDALRKPTAFIHVCKRFLTHFKDLILFRRSMYLQNGNALAASLFKSTLDLGVEHFTDVEIETFISNKNGISGVTIHRNGESIEIKAKAVVSAAGGFPHNQKLLNKYVAPRAGAKHFSAAVPENTGSIIELAEKIGAAISSDYREGAAWAPCSRVKRADGSVGKYPHLLERGKPGIIAVGPDGHRFTNEANCYHMFQQGYFDTYSDEQPVSWVIADHKAYRRWGLGWAKPAPFLNLRALKTGYLLKANSLNELAQKMGVPSDSLNETVARFNDFAAKGKDLDFNRGESTYNKGVGDFEHKPNPSLGELKKPPFYAVKLDSGSLGTFIGLKTNHECQVVNAADEPIPGLYAVGNEAASIFRGDYPSGGITLGPAMTFGYLCGKAIGKHFNNKPDN
ncbi:MULTISPECIES: FAD-dependent oxidoreductase [unclassified Marinobacterium]|uniref:FAD-dependent oxidoreductase n=1 Tax=unclassified Marinobacterium TaxID=2644139 RepID=UPI00156826EC|nr:3-oxosteroid 1-dehydrogenase [Marinobacterium sp. xm-v-242]NRP76947.1 3-oxosteroid 1-dehydrogenase [Marinobacterium sp. xm-m-383]